MVKPQLFHGCFIHTIDGKLNILENRYLTVEDGKITSISSSKPDGDYDIVETTHTQIIVPGLIDAHIHASQYSYCGCGFDLPLLLWLNKYAFPTESRYTDLEYASRVYNTVVRRTLAAGTTTASYFATIDSNSTLILANACRYMGQRAFVGKVTMDCNSPNFYTEKSTEEAISNVNNFLSKFGPTNEDDLVHPILTPRFAPTCSMEVMKKFGEMQKNNPSLRLQTHISENLNEIELVKTLFPDSPHYTGVYDEAGVLNSNTILAHGVHLKDEELALISSKGASVVHCPSSNYNIYSGLCDVRRLKDANVNVCLGTDVAGGSSISMIDAMRSALLCSRSIYLNKRPEQGGENPYKPLNMTDVFSMATECGAKALGLGDKIGNFVVGKEFDALIVDLDAGSTDCFGDESINDLFEKFIYTADDRNILRVYVHGKLVKRQ